MSMEELKDRQRARSFAKQACEYSPEAQQRSQQTFPVPMLVAVVMVVVMATVTAAAPMFRVVNRLFATLFATSCLGLSRSLRSLCRRSWRRPSPSGLAPRDCLRAACGRATGGRGLCMLEMA